MILNQNEILHQNHQLKRCYESAIGPKNEILQGGAGVKKSTFNCLLFNPKYIILILDRFNK